MYSFSTDGMKTRPLPRKKRGQHRFIAIASFVVSEEAMRHKDPAILDHENLWDLAFGCIDCEQAWTPELNNFCPAPEYVDR